MSVYIPKNTRPNSVCKMVPGLLLNGNCKPNECGKCGWNPEIHRERLKKLHQMSSRGKLRDWGKSNE